MIQLAPASRLAKTQFWGIFSVNIWLFFVIQIYSQTSADHWNYMATSIWGISMLIFGYLIRGMPERTPDPKNQSE